MPLHPVPPRQRKSAKVTESKQNSIDLSTIKCRCKSFRMTKKGASIEACQGSCSCKKFGLRSGDQCGCSGHQYHPCDNPFSHGVHEPYPIMEGAFWKNSIIDHIFGKQLPPLAPIHPTPCFAGWLAKQYKKHAGEFSRDATPVFESVTAESVFQKIAENDFDKFEDLLDDDDRDENFAEWKRQWDVVKKRDQDDPERVRLRREFLLRLTTQYPASCYRYKEGKGRDTGDWLWYYSFCADDLKDRTEAWHCATCGQCERNQVWHCNKGGVCRGNDMIPCHKCGGVSAIYKSYN